MLDKPNALPFKQGQFVVYPGRGAGVIREIMEEQAAGLTFRCYVIVTREGVIKLAVNKAINAGLRAKETIEELDAAIGIVRKRSKVKRGQWREKVAIYENKIGSGSLRALAEIIRDLQRPNTSSSDDTLNISYSEHVILERAHAFFIPEMAAILQISEAEAAKRLATIIDEASRKFDEMCRAPDPAKEDGNPIPPQPPPENAKGNDATQENDEMLAQEELTRVREELGREKAHVQRLKTERQIAESGFAEKITKLEGCLKEESLARLRSEEEHTRLRAQFEEIKAELEALKAREAATSQASTPDTVAVPQSSDRKETPLLPLGYQMDSKGFVWNPAWNKTAKAKRR